MLFSPAKILQRIAKPHHREHVKYLLGKEPLPWQEEDLHHLSILNPTKCWAYFGLHHVPGFKFPTRVLATLVVTVMCVYQVKLPEYGIEGCKLFTCASSDKSKKSEVTVQGVRVHYGDVICMHV